MGRIEKSGPRAFGDVLDAVFGFAVLMMSVYSAERESLVGFGNRSLKLLGVKQAVVSVIMPGLNAVRGENAFERKFRFDCGVGVHFASH